MGKNRDQVKIGIIELFTTELLIRVWITTEEIKCEDFQLNPIKVKSPVPQ